MHCGSLSESFSAPFSPLLNQLYSWLFFLLLRNSNEWPVPGISVTSNTITQHSSQHSSQYSVTHAANKVASILVRFVAHATPPHLFHTKVLE